MARPPDLGARGKPRDERRAYRHYPLPRQLPTLHGAFYRTALHPLLKRINAYLRWLRKNCKRLHGYKRAKPYWDGITRRDPGMFAHSQWNRGLVIRATRAR